MRSPSAIASALKRRVGANVKRLRLAAKLTQRQVAERAGLDLRHLIKIEHAQANVTISTLVRLANAFGVDVPALLERPPRR
jgi:transcriptional regulator with XRE-family HTH domain